MNYKAKDIAELLQVSTATVSLVLNGRPGVSFDTRQMILNKIQELGCTYLLKDNYTLCSSADLKPIGFVVYKRCEKIINESPFYTYILEEINQAALSKGYSLNFVYINRNMTDVEKLQQISQMPYAGLIIFAVEMFFDDLPFFIDSGLPFICFDNSFPEHEIDSVSINNVQGIHRAFEYLIGCGHTKIGYIKSKVAITSFIDRYAQYRRDLENHNLPFQQNYVIEVDYSELDGKKDVAQYLNTCDDLPTAFLADNDLLACYAMSAIKEKGFKIPDDISIIGFDNRPVSTVISPALTTVNIPLELFGPKIVEILVDKIETRRTRSIQVEIGTNIVERNSVKIFNDSK